MVGARARYTLPYIVMYNSQARAIYSWVWIWHYVSHVFEPLYVTLFDIVKAIMCEAYNVFSRSTYKSLALHI